VCEGGGYLKKKKFDVDVKERKMKKKDVESQKQEEEKVVEAKTLKDKDGGVVETAFLWSYGKQVPLNFLPRCLPNFLPQIIPLVLPHILAECKRSVDIIAVEEPLADWHEEDYLL
jgi:hypothetical protein